MIVLTGTEFFEAIGRLARVRFRSVVDFSVFFFFRGCCTADLRDNWWLGGCLRIRRELEIVAVLFYWHCSRVQILYYLRNFVVIIFASFPNLIFRYFYSPNNTLHSSATILARFQNKIQQDFTTPFLRNNNQAALFCRATSFSSLLSTKSRFPSLNPLVNPPTQTTRPTPQGTP